MPTSLSTRYRIVPTTLINFEIERKITMSKKKGYQNNFYRDENITATCEVCRPYHTPVGMKMALTSILEEKSPYYGVIKEHGKYTLAYLEFNENDDILRAARMIDKLLGRIRKCKPMPYCSLSSEQVLTLVGFGRGYVALVDLDSGLGEVYGLTHSDEVNYDQYTYPYPMAEERHESRFYEPERCACADAKEIPIKDLWARTTLKLAPHSSAQKGYMGKITCPW